MEHKQPQPIININDAPTGRFTDVSVRAGDSLSVTYRLVFDDGPDSTERQMAFKARDFERFMDLMRGWSREVLEDQGITTDFDENYK